MRTPCQHGATTCKLKYKNISSINIAKSVHSTIKYLFCAIPLRWWFAGGLYMMKLAPGSLRLTALYGLIIAASVICFGASVGNWIDKTRRLTGKATPVLNFEIIVIILKN